MHRILLFILIFILSCEEITEPEPEDCAGVAGGTAVEDDCGVCDGIDGYVAGSCYDCADIPNGDAEFDNCGVCDADTSNDCSQDCLGVWGGDATLAECEALGDLATLQEIINLNNLHPNDAPFYEPTEIGEQTWTDGRITSLDLSNWSLDTLPSSISNFTALTNLNLKSNNISVLPNTISNLTALASLDLYGNDLTALPEEICTIYDALTTLELFSNHICPPYPECITDNDLYSQNQNECESIGCMDNTACNYDETALYSYLNATCWYTNEGCDCSHGQGSVADNCDVCDTDSTNDCVQDCAGTWGGDAVEDCTGVCEGTHIDSDCGTVTDIDGNEYKTIKIGEQNWMAENLKVTHYNNGDSFSSYYEGHPSCLWDCVDINEIDLEENITGFCIFLDGIWEVDGSCADDCEFEESWMLDMMAFMCGQLDECFGFGNSQSICEELFYAGGQYAVYDNDPSNADIYGNLYNWAVVGDDRGVCPEGWHVPSDAEYTILTDYLGGESVAGGKMKEAGTEHWNSPNTGATNESGFTALPGGYLFANSGNDAHFDQVGIRGYFWTRTFSSSDKAYIWEVNSNNGVWHGTHARSDGASIRCLKD